ncbi:strubbelig-receptor family [Musa troglodytarum]|uniref:Strubbelig-receptor family n=1 Tax=Musa troglodytarum TaxID=320322 RepID=A0A9E7EU97_9LILI|nr:strubbelig-receptor family [Musa troglodytarum]URD82123.1 strubbelig-receptor family [Musa troglodytarum]URD82124.1 strubbelig-receptor family [Musa troglodytarum]
MFPRFSLVLTLLFYVPFSHGYTYEQDVYAINYLYLALGFPLLPGWTAFGGDPCNDNWQGVQCVNSNISAIILDGANLGGELGDKLGNFTSLITMDLSDNQIGGRIPESLPITIRKFFLSANKFTGSIPGSLSGLTLLSDMSLNNNLLSGELPDAFQTLTGLINLDLSDNNFSGQLAPSMKSLSSLTTLHIQNNQLSGTLDVLQDLPLQDLNVENNMFSGQIPATLLNIPNFKKGGNPFNASIAPSPLPPTPTTFPFSHAPAPANSFKGPTQNGGLSSENNKISIIKAVEYVCPGVILLAIVTLMAILNVSKWQQKKLKDEGIHRGQDVRKDERPEEPHISIDLIKPHKGDEVLGESTQRQEYNFNIQRTIAHPMPQLIEKDTVYPVVTGKKILRDPAEILNPPTSVAPFSVASLQQHTNSFSEENLIQDGSLGPVYLAEFPQGKLLEVVKLDNKNSDLPGEEFLKLVRIISEIQHPNIVELVGYCMEFGQRLLIYKYFSSKTLFDVIHSDDVAVKEKLSWNARIQIALEAAKALEYLHEGCRPPIVHQRFESSNILIDDDLSVQVSECGLTSPLPSSFVIRLSGTRPFFSYDAPEVSDSGSYSEKSDVYSFGIVMLELLTGRKPFDSSLPWAEQHLVRWASSQLHDIDALIKMMDPSVDGQFHVKSLSRFADIISRCIQQGSEFRPPMSEVVQDLARVI